MQYTCAELANDYYEWEIAYYRNKTHRQRFGQWWWNKYHTKTLRSSWPELYYENEALRAYRLIYSTMCSDSI